MPIPWFYFRFRGHSRHGGPVAGLVPVANDPQATSWAEAEPRYPATWNQWAEAALSGGSKVARDPGRASDEPTTTRLQCSCTVAKLAGGKDTGCAVYIDGQFAGPHGRFEDR